MLGPGGEEGVFGGGGRKEGVLRCVWGEGVIAPDVCNPPPLPCHACIGWRNPLIVTAENGHLEVVPDSLQW